MRGENNGFCGKVFARCARKAARSATAPRAIHWLCQIAQRGAFERERDDRQARGIGGGLAQETVFRTTANHENPAETPPAQTFEHTHRVRVARAERNQKSAAHNPATFAGGALFSF